MGEAIQTSKIRSEVHCSWSEKTSTEVSGGWRERLWEYCEVACFHPTRDCTDLYLGDRLSNVGEIVDQFYLSDAVILHLSLDLALKHIIVPRAGAWYLRVWQDKLCDGYSLIKTIISEDFVLFDHHPCRALARCFDEDHLNIPLYFGSFSISFRHILCIQHVARKTKHDRSLRTI